MRSVTDAGTKRASSVTAVFIPYFADRHSRTGKLGVYLTKRIVEKTPTRFKKFDTIGFLVFIRKMDWSNRLLGLLYARCHKSVLVAVGGGFQYQSGQACKFPWVSNQWYFRRKPYRPPAGRDNRLSPSGIHIRVAFLWNPPRLSTAFRQQVLHNASSG